MSLYHAKLSYWKFSTRIDCKYSNKKKKKKKNLSRIEGIWNDKERKCTQESLYEDNVD